MLAYHRELFVHQYCLKFILKNDEKKNLVISSCLKCLPYIGTYFILK